MLRMVHLIGNENMKLYRQVGTWIMVSLMVIVLSVIAGASSFVNKQVDPTQVKQVLEQQKMMLKQDGVTEVQKKTINKSIKILQFCIDKKINLNRLSFFLESTFKSVSLISLVTIIVAAGIVGREFANGTIKLLLTRPIRRSMILLSKYITVLFFGGSMLLFHFLCSSVMISILFKPALVVYTYSDFLTTYGDMSVKLLFMATLAFMISTVFRSTAFAIGVTLFLYCTGDSIAEILSMYFGWTKYLFLSNLDLSRYSDSGGSTSSTVLDGMTLSFSIKVLVVYYVVFILASWYSFSKRDISV